MAFEIWYRDDLADSIASTVIAMMSAAIANGATNEEYCRGLLDFARAQALSYGIPWDAMKTHFDAALLGGGSQALIDNLYRRADLEG